MKQAHELTAQPDFADMSSWLAGNPKIFRTVLKKLRSAKLKESRRLIQSGTAALAVALLFLAGSYLFLVQLAEYGW